MIKKISAKMVQSYIPIYYASDIFLKTMGTPQQYLETQFPQDLLASRYSNYSEGYKRQSKRAVKIFNRFMERKFHGQDITMQHLVAFMMYRCAGEVEGDRNDRHNGAVNLGTFRSSEIVNLIQLLIHERRVSFSAKDFIDSEEYKTGVSALKRVGLGCTGFTHARPLYHQDEIRLRSCLTEDTASLRDESLIILLRECGARSASVTAVRLDMHIFETSRGALEISVPSCKTEYNIMRTVVLMDDDADILRMWIRVRKTMFPSNPYLFVTSVGSTCDTNDITQMLYKLGQCAGYGPKFFTSHSFRVGYASNVAAQVFANGGSLQEAIDELQSQNLWSRQSNAVERYIDRDLSKFFRGRHRLTYARFLSLSPDELHGIAELNPAQKRPLTWFHHSEQTLSSACAWFEITAQEDQYACRAEIGSVMRQLDPSFASFAQEVVAQSGKGLRQVLSEIVGCLLQGQWIDVVRWVDPVYREEFINILCVKAYPQQARLRTRVGQRTEVHKLVGREQASLVRRALCRRPYDRMVHLGRLSDGNLVRLKVREIEEEIPQIAALRSLDLDIHFPEQDSSPLNRAISSGNDVTTTPTRTSGDPTRFRVTPSTATSTPPMNREC